jgi:hypothetical protein
LWFALAGKDGMLVKTSCKIMGIIIFLFVMNNKLAAQYATASNQSAGKGQTEQKPSISAPPHRNHWPLTRALDRRKCPVPNEVVSDFIERRNMAKCPYCKQAVTLEQTKIESTALEQRNNEPTEAVETVHKEVKGWIRKVIMYSCPHCDSVLGFGQDSI